MQKKLKAGCIIISKTNPQNILLVKSNYEKGFAFPKGHLEEGESLEECALREIQEETGLNVKLIKKLGTFEYPDYYCDELGEVSFYLANSLSDEINYNIKTDNEKTTMWVNYKEIKNMDLINHYKEFYSTHFKEIENYIEEKIKVLKRFV